MEWGTHTCHRNDADGFILDLFILQHPVEGLLVQEEGVIGLIDLDDLDGPSALHGGGHGLLGHDEALRMG